MKHLIDLLYVGLQCVSRGYKLLNLRQTFEILGIIQEIIRRIVLVQLNMLTWLHKTSLPGRPAALLMLLETYHSSLGA
jgi:hypothetical protein